MKRYVQKVRDMRVFSGVCVCICVVEYNSLCVRVYMCVCDRT